MDDEMNQITRVRECKVCGERWHTVEVLASDLSELRRKAHIGVMAGVK